MVLPPKKITVDLLIYILDIQHLFNPVVVSTVIRRCSIYRIIADEPYP